MNIGTNGFQMIMHGNSVAVALASYTTTISTWAHLAMRSAAKQGSILLNGAIVRTGYTCPTTYLYSPKTHILSGDYGVYAGYVDEIRVWNYVRSEAETQRDMYRRVEPGEYGLIQLIRWSGVDNALMEFIEKPMLAVTTRPLIYMPPIFIMEH
jgi:hypothetical protein